MTYSNVGRLLIVDDEIAQAAALARTLQIEGYSCTEAHSAPRSFLKCTTRGEIS